MTVERERLKLTRDNSRDSIYVSVLVRQISTEFVMSDAIDIYITGLKNAHGMEHQALSIMKPQLKRIERYEDVAERLERHIGETQAQIDRLDTLLDDLGAGRSAVKDMVLGMGGAMAAIGHTFAPDETVKNSFANFAFENYEIAAYTSLLTLAPTVHSDQAEQLLQASLNEEQAMADWIRERIPVITEKYATLRELGQEAKR